MNNSMAWIAPGPEIMELPSRLDSSTAPVFAEDALLCISSGAQDMILDASKMNSITAAGFRAFLTVAKALHDNDGTLSIRNMKPAVKEFFDVAGFGFVMTSEDDAAKPHLHALAA